MATSREPGPVPPVPAGPGELVCENGPQPGSRRALVFPFTLIGQAPNCDIRIAASGVSPHHCAIVLGPAGLMIRDLSSPSGTIVNGEAVGMKVVNDGDIISVGPFQFRLSIATSSDQVLPEAVPTEREADRIQNAIVEAQQAALTEQEGILLQREQMLNAQEQQLAWRLDSKRERLMLTRDEARKALAALDLARVAFENRVVNVMRAAAESRKELRGLAWQLQQDRSRLVSLRQRLKLRWHRQWRQEREQIRAEAARLTVGQDAIQAEKLHLAEMHIRLNAEIEIGRRSLEEARDEVRRERNHLIEQSRLVRERERRLEQSRQELNADAASLQHRRDLLTSESAGLEERIHGQRQTLQEREQDLARLEYLSRRLGSVHLGEAEEAAPEQEKPGREAAQQNMAMVSAQASQREIAKLDGLRIQLADQRGVLVEEFDRLAKSHENWLSEQLAVTAELECRRNLVESLEQDLLRREVLLRGAELQLCSRNNEATDNQLSLQAERSRLAAAEAEWDGRRTRLLAELCGRERDAESQLESVIDLRETWNNRRRRQVTWLLSRRTACENDRKHYAALGEELLRANERLAADRQAVAEKALALEQYRQEYIERSNRPVAAANRIKKLCRRWERYFKLAKASLAREQRRAGEEKRRLEERASEHKQHADSLAAREIELGSKESLREVQHHLVETEMATLRQESQTLTKQQTLYEDQLRKTHEELDRVTGMLLDTDDSSPARRAA